MSNPPNKDILKDFDFYTPMLSTDVLKVEKPTPNYTEPEKNGPVKIIKKKNKNKKKISVVRTVQNTETQEEIDAWIAARKARYPTSSRIAEKAEEEQERRERGALDLNNTKKPKKSNKPQELSSLHPTKIKSFLDIITEDQQRKEHSIILQCFRYFVQNNFLQDKK